MTGARQAAALAAPPRITAAGDSAVRVTLDDGVSAQACERVRAVAAALEIGRPAWLLDVVPSYRSVLAIYDCARASYEEARALVASAAAAAVAVTSQPGSIRVVEVPVFYDPVVAPDLEELAAAKSLPPSELAARHAAPEYLVAMLGFRPGFPFLVGLPRELACPRLASPRPNVPAGSVGIGGAQTGIYSVPSPGGWRIIGRTPLRLFDPGSTDPFLLRAGDHLRFVPIGPDRYCELAAG